MELNTKCPICGQDTINGICIDCGKPKNGPVSRELDKVKPPIMLSMTGDIITAKESALISEKPFEPEEKTDDSLNGVKPPIILSMADEIVTPEEVPLSELSVPQAEQSPQKAPGLYEYVIPYEKPDYGDRYTPPDTESYIPTPSGTDPRELVVWENGRPVALDADKIRAERRRREKSEWQNNDSWLKHWRKMLASLIMPYWIPSLMVLSFLIPLGLMAGRDKSSKKAGVILLILCIIKYFISAHINPWI